MSLSVCASCLARIRISVAASTVLPAASRIPNHTSSFHSSATRQNVVKKKTVVAQGTRAPKMRESRSARIVKKSKDRPKPPPVGQRRAERRRIVLSNTNALQVDDLEKLTPINMPTIDDVGEMFALDGPVLDQLREAKAFKTTQNWNMFRMPSTLIRHETAELAEYISMMGKESSDEELLDEEQDIIEPVTLNTLVVGAKGTGKSIHLVQAMSMAYLNNWIVINIPDCQEFVNNQSAYAPLPKSTEDEEQLYVQPQLAADILARLANSNTKLLANMGLLHNHPKLLKSKKVKNLHELALMGVQDLQLAPQVWDAVWKELTVLPETKDENESSQTVSRPPVLVAIDGINFWMGQTKYRSPDYKTIHAQQFALIRQFTNLVFKAEAGCFPSGGIVMACTTKSNHPSSPSFDVLTDQIRWQCEEENEVRPFPTRPPYRKLDDGRVYALFDEENCPEITELTGLSKEESKGLLEYFARSGMLREAVTDAAVSEKWTLSGGGIVGELCKITARVRTSMFDIGPREGIKLRGVPGQKNLNDISVTV